MTENQAYILDIVVGCLVTWGSVILLDALGANDQLQGVAAMLGIVGFSFMIGVITYLYNGKGDDDSGD